jgi:hemerythrin
MSAQIQWNDNLASGSLEIDTQHKELFQRINALLAGFDKGSIDRQEFSKTIQFLTDYVVFHFGNEENYMAKFAYSSTSQHKAQHEQFVKSFGKLKDRMMLEGLNPELAEETKQLLVDWLINHIKYSDRALGMFLKLKM